MSLESTSQQIETPPHNNFKFGTKAENLKNLMHLVKSAFFLDQMYFDLMDWSNNKAKITKAVAEYFPDTVVIVRSSSINEDRKDSSMAGEFDSIPRVFSKDIRSVENAIDKVVRSYDVHHGFNPRDQILIQPMLEEVDMAGVVFTRCNNTAAPYYIINYESLSGKTDGVTSGNGQNMQTFVFFKRSSALPSNNNLSKVIEMSRELEALTCLDHLDIEFAIKGDKIYILQVRPLVLKSEFTSDMDRHLEDAITNIQKFIRSNDKRFPNLFGYKAIYGNMPDWNPAEIIGESPSPLAFSLYRELITDHIWPLSRREVGYKDVGYHPGVVSLGGKPYVDVRLSFNTFVPASLSETTSDKLVNFYIGKLINNPGYHDKIEFKIAHTCYKFGFKEEENEMLRNNFSPAEISEIKSSLISLTNDILNGKITTIESELGLSEILEEKRRSIAYSDIEVDAKISKLLYDCKIYGTLPFSKLARFAFIGNILLSSLVSSGVITADEKEKVFRSINSVARDLTRSLNSLKKGDISKQEFLSKFGHLRPGTYDFNSKTYNVGFEDYFNFTNDYITEDYTDYNLSTDTMVRIQKAIDENGFTFNADEMINFVKSALAAREKSKFEFTKNVSLILDYCGEYVRQFGFSDEDVPFFEISDIISLSSRSKSMLEMNALRDKILQRKKYHPIMKAIKLPSLLYLDRSVNYFHYLDNKPNFITSKQVAGEIVSIDEKNQLGSLDNKIVMITNADPGYDWIFGYNIKGLVTKYGGVGSHMSVRCSEFGIPAAIGCGSVIFDSLKKYNTINIDCASKQIRGVA